MQLNAFFVLKPFPCVGLRQVSLNELIFFIVTRLLTSEHRAKWDITVSIVNHLHGCIEEN